MGPLYVMVGIKTINFSQIMWCQASQNKRCLPMYVLYLGECMLSTIIINIGIKKPTRVIKKPTHGYQNCNTY